MAPQLAFPRSFQITFVLVGITSLWIRMLFPIMANGGASHDDLLFVRQAAEIGMGNWLGGYSNLTHAKGMVYSLFLLVNHATGIPLKFSEQLIYLLAAAFFSVTIGRLYRSRWAALVTFVLLAFVPTAWIDGAGGRVVREGLYVSLSLLLLTLGIRSWVLPCLVGGAGMPRQENWWLVVLLGVVAALFWLTREEGVWLLPAMAVLAAYWVARQFMAKQPWKSILSLIAVPLVVATLLVGVVNSINYAVYGVFRNNDFRSSDFQSGYGALTRIHQDEWRRYVPFPADARHRAYEMSAAARELKPFFEGEGGETWRRIGCDQTDTNPCPEILSGWFMWALRDAVAQAGYYKDARSAQAFYRRLAAEIDEGCRQRPTDCLSRRDTLVPPWHPSYARDTALTTVRVFQTLATLGNLQPSLGHSSGTANQLALFRLVTNGPLAPVAGAKAEGPDLVSPRDVTRYSLAIWLSNWESRISTVGLPLAFFVWSLWLAAALFVRRNIDTALVVTTALAAAIVTRVVLLAFLEATSIPSNNMLYLFPLAPISLAMIPVALWGGLHFFWPKVPLRGPVPNLN